MTSCLAVGGRGYNGWPNYETWLTALWIDNEEWSYRHWRASARGLRLEAPLTDHVRRDGMSVEEGAACLLADEIRASVEAYMPDWGATMYSDLLRRALSEVEWLAIAKHILEDAP